MKADRIPAALSWTLLFWTGFLHAALPVPDTAAVFTKPGTAFRNGVPENPRSPEPVAGRAAGDRSVFPLDFLAEWGGYGSGNLELKDPQGIDSDPMGAIYISDTGNHRIQKWTGRGEFVSLVGGYGWEKEHFNHPAGLNAGNGLDVFIADFANQRIERYDRDLHYLSTLSATDEWPGHLRFGFPKDVELSSQGEMYCVDGENNRILKMDVFGNPQTSFGDFDSGEGRLNRPHGIVCSRSGMVFISDGAEHRIMVYDHYGNFLTSFGEDRLDRPAGLCSLNTNTLLIADPGTASIFAYSQGGRYIGEYPPPEGGPVSFTEPVDVTAVKDLVYVLDRQKSSVLVFRIPSKEREPLP